jgi:protein-S-isoprenylcysteine O-methyltransferase Ste14
VANYKKFSKRWRMPLGFLLALVYVLLARPVPERLIAGLALAFLGLLLRAWAAGHIEKNSQLAIAGPYAFVRNPLYLGSFLIALGFAVACQWIFVFLVVGFFILIYAPNIEQERLTMTSLFPDEYPAYAANVPPFVPRISPWKPAPTTDTHTHTGTGFSPQRYMRHSEWKAALGYIAGCAWLVLRLKLGL